VFSYVALGPEWKDLPVENIGLFRRQVAGVEIAGAYALEFGPDKGANELGIYGYAHLLGRGGPRYKMTFMYNGTFVLHAVAHGMGLSQVGVEDGSA